MSTFEFLGESLQYMFFDVFFSKTPQVHIFKTRNEEMRRDEERGVVLKHCLF
jgi:hypothetical protein